MTSGVLVVATLAWSTRLPDLELEVLESNGPAWSGVEMADATGRRFSCSATASGSSSGSQRAEPKTVGDLLASLEGVCARANHGWWTYEWCHRQSIRQYHQEVASGPREPDWSLGEYTRSVGDESLGLRSLSSVVDIFDAGGQGCDETQRGRASTVRFACCETKSRRRRRPEAAILTSVDETALCEYNLSVCAPSLCAGNATAARLLQRLDGVCLTMPQGWWTFEFCYKKYARQFHVDNDDSRRIEAQFSLGQHQSVDDDDVAVVQGDRPRVELEYADGTECDLTQGLRRATTVRLYCGDDNALVNVFEDRTCHYVFSVHTPALCQHPAFVVKPKARFVKCTSLSDDLQQPWLVDKSAQPAPAPRAPAKGRPPSTTKAKAAARVVQDKDGTLLILDDELLREEEAPHHAT